MSDDIIEDHNEELAQEAAEKAAFIARMETHIAEMGTDVNTLQVLGEAAWHLTNKINDLEAQTKAEKKELTKLLELMVPGAMAEQGLQEFGFDTPDGTRARLNSKVQVRGTLTNAPDIEVAVRKLEDAGLVGVVKTTLSVDLTEAERNQLADLRDGIGDLTGKDVNTSRSINAGTLAAFGRRMLKQDSTWDYEAVGLTAWTVATFSKK